MTEIGPWMFAIVPGPPVEPMLTVASGAANDIDRLVIGEHVDRAAVVGAGGDVEHATDAGVVDVDRVDAALAVDLVVTSRPSG